MQRARLNERQMETVRKVLRSEDFEQLSQYVNTRYGQLRGTPSHLASNGEKQGRPIAHSSNIEGISRRSVGGGTSGAVSSSCTVN